jgi:putative transposase
MSCGSCWPTREAPERRPPARREAGNTDAGSETGAKQGTQTPGRRPALRNMTPRTKREYLTQLVSEKNRWFPPLTDAEKALGFLGWHERGYLPHCDYPGLVQFVTFRLADSMPGARRGEWEYLFAIEDVREKRTKLEEYLDRGLGACCLRDVRVAQIVEDALLYFHDDRYEMLAWCVMPNHVHLLVHIWRMPLWKLVRSWKKYVATHAESILLERRPPARRELGENPCAPAWKTALQWQREYWDTFMRNEEQEKTGVHYIEKNPVRAMLCRTPNEWPVSSARFRDQYHRLAIPKSTP